MNVGGAILERSEEELLALQPGLALLFERLERNGGNGHAPVAEAPDTTTPKRAPMSETRSAARIVRNDRVKPTSSDDRTVRPERTSSLRRSKYTT